MSIEKVMVKAVQVGALSLCSALVLADCNFREGGTVQTSMPLLGVNLTVGRDIPLGSEVYRQTFQVPALTGVVCSPGVYKSTFMRGLPVTPLPLSSWSGAPYAGKVYETGVPGIGAVLWVAGIALPFNQTRDNCGGGIEECYTPYQDGMAFDLSFIKIGDVSPGTVLGSSLPTMDQKWLSTNTLDIQYISMSGAINIVSRTCDTPNVQVELGTRQLREFTGVGSFTPWKEFAITLLNCPAFHGFYQGTGPRWLSDGSVENLDSRTNNMLRYRLDPTQAPIDAINGVIRLNASGPDENPAASGVGIQIADEHSDAVPLSTLRDSAIVTAAIEGGSYSIPLLARYLQTEDQVTAGPANGSVVFTINYQ